MKVEVKSYKATPFNFYESNLYHGEILVASGPTGAEILRLAARAIWEFGFRGPTCDQNFTMIEVRFIKNERGCFVALDLYSHMAYSEEKKHLSCKSYSRNSAGGSDPQNQPKMGPI